MGETSAMDVAVLDALRAVPGGDVLLDVLGEREDVWIVGGAVRDALLGRPPKDLDVIVAGDAVALARELGDVQEIHDRFGTTAVVVGGGTVNVATARTERYPMPGALPVVEPAGLQDDLRRRDFTVNAIAADLGGGLHEFPGARDDLTARRMRVLHDGSFHDDPTRLWRMARYATRLGFAVEENTERLAREAVAAGVLDTVAGQRLGAELRLALVEPDPMAALCLAHDLGLMPEGTAPCGHLHAVAKELLPGEADAGILALAAMALGVDPVRLRAWLDDLGVPARERDTVVAAATGARALADSLATAERPSAIAAVARGHRTEAVALAGALGAEDAARAWLDELRHVSLEITGDDLLAAGIPAGRDLGERLERALAARLDGEARGREQELAVALS